MSNGNLINELKKTILKDGWLESMYGTSKTKQQSELKQMFIQVQDDNLSDDEKKAILAKKVTLEDKLEQIEAKMAVLGEQLEQNQEKIDKLADEITTLITNTDKKSQQLNEEQIEWAKQVVIDVFDMYKNGTISGADAMAAEMNDRMKEFSNSSLTSEINTGLSSLKSKKSQVAELCGSVSGLIDQKKILESQYGITKTTFSFLSKTLGDCKKTASYTNSDFNSVRPIYSTNKLETCSELFGNQNINVASTNSEFKENTSEPSLTSIEEKYSSYFSPESKDISTEDSITNLGKALDDGLLGDLATAGIRGSKLVDFLSTNFAKAGIQKKENGALSIPIGNETDVENAKDIFSKVTEYASFKGLSDKASEWASTSFLGAKNTWDKNQGNTINSNAQIKSLSENYTGILEDMKNKNFTFKEAMFALFNPESGLFKDTGIVYDLKNQKGTPNYYMEYAGDDETAELFKNIAADIYKTWGVKPTLCADWENYKTPENSDIDIIRDDTPIKKPEPEPEPEPEPVKPNPVRPVRPVIPEPEPVPDNWWEDQSTDPLSFKGEDGIEYSFVIDRNKDGRFNDKTEFVGGTQSSSWYEDLKSLDKNGDGILEGDELDNLAIFGQKYNESNSISKEQTTSVNYIFKTAKDAGIEKIDLNAIKDVGKSTGKHDVNGSEIFEDKFNFEMNGKTYEASRKDETATFMDAIYKDSYNARIDGKIGFDEKTVNEEIDKNYKEFDDFSNQYSAISGNLNFLNNFDSTYQQTEDKINQNIQDSQDEANIIIRKGQNKAHAQKGNVKWDNTMRDSVRKVATDRGISVNSEFYEQTKGIYMSQGGTAEEIVTKYQELLKEQENIELRQKYTTMAISTMIECSKQNINVTMNDILNKFTSKEATSVDEAVKQLLEEFGTKEFSSNYDQSAKAIQEFEKRSNEIYSAFNKVFNAQGKDNKVVDALYDLVQTQVKSGNYMQGKSAEDIANEFAKKYKK